MEKKRNSASEFLERNQHEGRIVVQSALLELWARQQSALNELELIKQTLSGYADYMEKMDERLMKLEPTIKVISEQEAKSILKG